MAVPFRRVSKTRRDKSPECGEYKMSHKVCKHCGTYKGQKVL